jgi:hypothetical protein
MNLNTQVTYTLRKIMCDSSFTVPATIPKSTLVRLKCEYECRHLVSNKEASETLAEIQRKVLSAAALGRSTESFEYPTRVLKVILAHVYTMLPGCAFHSTPNHFCSTPEKMSKLTISWD